MLQKAEIKYHNHKCCANNDNNHCYDQRLGAQPRASNTHGGHWVISPLNALFFPSVECLIFSICRMRGSEPAFQYFFQPETSFHFFPFIFPSSFLFFLNLKNLIQKLKVKSRGALAERDSIPELGLFAQLYLSPLGIPRTLRDKALKTLISCSALFYVISKPQSVAQC